VKFLDELEPLQNPSFVLPTLALLTTAPVRHQQTPKDRNVAISSDRALWAVTWTLRGCLLVWPRPLAIGAISGRGPLGNAGKMPLAQRVAI